MNHMLRDGKQSPMVARGKLVSCAGEFLGVGLRDLYLLSVGLRIISRVLLKLKLGCWDISALMHTNSW